jgi:hypothetical protein
LKDTEAFFYKRKPTFGRDDSATGFLIGKGREPSGNKESRGDWLWSNG